VVRGLPTVAVRTVPTVAEVEALRRLSLRARYCYYPALRGAPSGGSYSGVAISCCERGIASPYGWLAMPEGFLTKSRLVVYYACDPLWPVLHQDGLELYGSGERCVREHGGGVA
jgi:hypothetical protein